MKEPNINFVEFKANSYQCIHVENIDTGEIDYIILPIFYPIDNSVGAYTPFIIFSIDKDKSPLPIYIDMIEGLDAAKSYCVNEIALKQNEG